LSHVSRIELEIHSLEDLKAACKRLGFQFVENQTEYKWYGRFVGDYPLPEGIQKEDLGKCTHAIRVPECQYEIGVVKKNNHFILLWDSWRRGGLEQRLGKKAGVLKQAYASERIRREAKLKGYRVQEKKTNKGIRLVLSAA
jgi:hypothetical protein